MGPASLIVDTANPRGEVAGRAGVPPIAAMTATSAGCSCAVFVAGAAGSEAGDRPVSPRQQHLFMPSPQHRPAPGRAVPTRAEHGTRAANHATSARENTARTLGT